MSDEIFEPCGSADGRAGRPATADGRARTPSAPQGDDFGRGERVERGESLTTDYADYTDVDGRVDFNAEEPRSREDAALPDGWRRVRLSEIGEVCMCKRVMKSETSTTGEIPFYKIGTFGKQADAFISRALYESYRGMYSFPKKGDVLISAAGTIGRTVVFDGADSYFQDSNIVWLDNDESQVTNEYLHWCYQVTNWQTEDGGIVERLYNGNFNATAISLPPLPEQRAIAGVLGRVDQLVDNLAKRIAKKKAIKRGVMADLLTGKRRLAAANDGRACRPATADGRARTPAAPQGDDFGRGERVERGESLTTDCTDYTDLEGRDDFNTEAQRHRADAALPAGWRRTTYGELGTVIGGGTPSTSVESFWNGEINWFTPAEIGESKYVSKSERRITDSGLRNSAARILPPGSILLTTRASIGLTAINLEPTAMNQGFQSLIVNESNDVEFVYYFIDTLKHEMISRASGSTFLEISPNKLKSIPISLPPLPEQRAIAGVLGAMDAEIAKLEAKKAKIEQLKQGLMSDLLSGRVRIVGDGK